MRKKYQQSKVKLLFIFTKLIPMVNGKFMVSVPNTNYGALPYKRRKKNIMGKYFIYYI